MNIVGVDIGGTFTDLVAFDHQTQKVTYAKSPTNYDNLVEGILDCFNKAAVRPAEASLVNHGTTLVINSLIQRKGAKTALVTEEPSVYFTTHHFDGYAAVLVRLDEIDVAALTELVGEAWACRAPKRLLEQYPSGPPRT